MASQRALQQSVRRLAVQRASPLNFVPGFQSPAAILLQKRWASSTSSPLATSVTPSDSMKILENQRLHRPVSPHLQIYKPQVTWVLSSLTRITGLILGGSMYLFGIAYAAAPLLGWKLSSAALAASFAKWPVALKFLTKFVYAWPFTFHSLQGIRHFIWDVGAGITNKQVITSGWAVVGLSVVSALYLCFI